VYRKFSRYEYPKNIMILGRTKASRRNKTEILEKISLELHCSTRKIRNEYLPFFKITMKNQKFKKNFLENFDLTREDIKDLLSK
jgi:hypothetical protein